VNIGIGDMYGLDLLEEEASDPEGFGLWQPAGCPHKHALGSPGLMKKLLHSHLFGPLC